MSALKGDDCSFLLPTLRLCFFSQIPCYLIGNIIIFFFATLEVVVVACIHIFQKSRPICKSNVNTPKNQSHGVASIASFLLPFPIGSIYGYIYQHLTIHLTQM